MRASTSTNLRYQRHAGKKGRADALAIQVPTNRLYLAPEEYHCPALRGTPVMIRRRFSQFGATAGPNCFGLWNPGRPHGPGRDAN